MKLSSIFYAHILPILITIITIFILIILFEIIPRNPFMSDFTVGWIASYVFTRSKEIIVENRIKKLKNKINNYEKRV